MPPLADFTGGEGACRSIVAAEPAAGMSLFWFGGTDISSGSPVLWRFVFPT